MMNLRASSINPSLNLSVEDKLFTKDERSAAFKQGQEAKRSTLIKNQASCDIIM